MTVKQMDPEEYTFNVHTEVFEGPLDLLLHLIKKNKMDILDIKISEITSEYLYYLEDRRRINPSREGDFLMTASTLIYIKSRSLLPKPDILEDEESPEQKLVHTLMEHEKIQKISRMLKELEGQELLLWKREEVIENFETKEFKLEEVTSFQLAEIFLHLVKRKEKEDFLYIDSKNYSVEKKWKEILELLETEGYLNFNQYIERLDSIEEILVSFFTILEMIKQRVIIGIQKRLFDTISIWKTNNDENEKEPIQ
ncbi:MAG: segregation/condensation protein A [Candidatus Aminicenantes bacterium]|nr:MAG: segregation/condensation protein A [Candidatus Aminicenantes bacterium]